MGAQAEAPWEPPAELVERATMTRFMRERGFDDYQSLDGQDRPVA